MTAYCLEISDRRLMEPKEKLELAIFSSESQFMSHLIMYDIIRFENH